MYDPYQLLVAKQIGKERREAADRARLVKQARGDRANLFSSLRSKLIFLIDRLHNRASIRQQVARIEGFNPRVPGLAEE
jgi:hypothetical protein